MVAITQRELEASSSGNGYKSGLCIGDTPSLVLESCIATHIVAGSQFQGMYRGIFTEVAGQ